MLNGSSFYDYDWQGNRLSATNGAIGAVYVPDALNQYDDVDGVAPVYDLDGNLLEIPGRMAMEYDAKDQMTFCSNETWRVWNTYDHIGRRTVKKTQYQNGAPSVRHYVYDGWNMIAETMPSGAPNHYLWGLDLSGAEQGAGGVGGLLGYLRGTTWFVPLYDANGNVTSYVNADLGRAVINYEFDAFGKMTSGNPTGIFRFRFSSKYFDVETGLYYYGHRFYDPIWGRWINRDPIEEAGGLNLYGFCGNDGVNQADFLGLWVGPNRTGEPWASVCAENGDTWENLAMSVGLSPSEYRNWVKEGPNLSSTPEKGKVYHIPNTIYAAYNGHGWWAGRMLEGYTRRVNHYKTMGYYVRDDYDRPLASSMYFVLREAWNDKSLQGFYYMGHGFKRIEVIQYRRQVQRSLFGPPSFVDAERSQPHGTGIIGGSRGFWLPMPYWDPVRPDARKDKTALLHDKMVVGIKKYGLAHLRIDACFSGNGDWYKLISTNPKERVLRLGMYIPIIGW